MVTKYQNKLESIHCFAFKILKRSGPLMNHQSALMRKLLTVISTLCFSGDNPDDDQLLKTPGDGASTNLFLYNVSLLLHKSVYPFWVSALLILWKKCLHLWYFKQGTYNIMTGLYYDNRPIVFFFVNFESIDIKNSWHCSMLNSIH